MKTSPAPAEVRLVPSKVFVGLTRVPVTYELPAVSIERPTESARSSLFAVCACTAVSMHCGPVWPPVGSLQLCPAAQAGPPPVQTPFWQLSGVVTLPVQARPSLQGVLFGWFAPPAQRPVAGAQVPPVVHWVVVQGTSPAPTQAPAALQENEANWSFPLHRVVALAAVQVAPVVAV